METADGEVGGLSGSRHVGIKKEPLVWIRPPVSEWFKKIYEFSGQWSVRFDFIGIFSAHAHFQPDGPSRGHMTLTDLLYSVAGRFSFCRCFGDTLTVWTAKCTLKTHCAAEIDKCSDVIRRQIQSEQQI